MNRMKISPECQRDWSEPQSAWELFRELMQNADSVQFACELCEKLGINTWTPVNQEKATWIMMEIKKEIEG